MERHIDAVLIAGPTASGKSRAALELAERIGGTVINADSMQVYRELRILTARPSDADAARAPHLLYGHVEAREPYSVGRYQRDAADALHAARASRRIPIFTGGTGLYFGALTDGIADVPPIPQPVRDAARERLQQIGVTALHAELARRDPETSGQLRPSDPQRVLRAYEVLEATGRPLAQWRCGAGKSILDGMRLAKFVLDVPRAELRVRIEDRFRSMMAQGAVDEAKALAEIDPALPAAKVLGLRGLCDLSRGRITEQDAVQAAITATRQFAKRQTTWFRHRMTDWNWLEAQEFGNILPNMMASVA